MGIGDRVCALLRGGGYSGFAVVSGDHCLPIPENLSFSQAAALPEALFTTWSNLVVDAQLTSPANVLINGGTSGIGIIAIQLLNALGHRVFASARGATKRDLCLRLGAACAIDTQVEKVSTVALAETAGVGIDVALDLIGGATLSDTFLAMAVTGRIQVISAVAGFDAEIDLFQLLRKRLTLAGTLLRPRSQAYKAAVANAIEEAVWPMVASGRITPLIDSEYDLQDAAKALARMERGEHLGKIILLVGSE